MSEKAETTGEKPFIDRECLLQKFPGKGGWTYAELPEIPPDPHAHFGWRTVRGGIDDYELKHFKLMPMGNGQLFLSVKKEIRKKIRKEAGDYVWVKLYPDRSPLDIPEEITDCFENEPPEALTNFMAFTDGERKAYLDWIYAAKTDDTKARRIVSMMDRLMKNLRLHDHEQPQ